MKKIFLLIVFSSLIFTSCSTVNPIVEDICEITEDICFYANLVCDNWEPSKANSELDLNTKSELIALRDEMQFINATLQPNQQNNKKFSDEDLKIKLIMIRDDLKRIVDRQKILK